MQDLEIKIDAWHEQKKTFAKKIINFQFQEREIWFCAIGFNIGYEQNGGDSKFERPVLVLRKFNKESFLGIPLTSHSKDEKSKLYMNYTLKDKEGALLLTQVRFLSAKRLSRYMAKMSKGDFKKVHEKIKGLISTP
jgi:mRNA-degrading endonuclease toxin of MazEF toxin-antitoxin module